MRMYLVSLCCFSARLFLAVMLMLSNGGSMAADGDSVHISADRQIVPMHIGDKWYFEKESLYRNSSTGWKDKYEYSPTVYTVIDTITVNRLKNFVIERYEIPSYKKTRENWYSDSLVFTVNGTAYFSKRIRKDSTWKSIDNYATFWYHIRTEAVLGVLCNTQTKGMRYSHTGAMLYDSVTVAEHIGLANMLHYFISNSSEKEGTRYRLVRSPGLTSGKPLNPLIVKLQKVKDGLEIFWNKSLEEDISHYRIFVNNKAVDSTAMADDTSRVVRLSPAPEQLLAVAAVDKKHVMSNYYIQKLSDYESAPTVSDPVLPERDKTIELPADPTIYFKWHYALDSDGDAITYNLHIRGGDDDTTVTGIATSEAYVRHRWLEHVKYAWTVQASDGYLTTSYPTRYFQVFYAVFEPPRIYPNPFSKEAKLFFRLASTSEVILTVYNARGQWIRDLFWGNRSAGPQTIVWNGLDDTNNPVASGVYVLVFQHEGKKYYRKMLLLK
jgi:hypothetical protein